ncbi:hypothetical protein LCGC14_0310560 [marine sediment metagenome]|uniref:Uncharacterized protein n=1 Tax=marine sediment metagenome TaxID=412755 RepID=A0A0F9WTR9_9ZZZZ
MSRHLLVSETGGGGGFAGLGNVFDPINPLSQIFNVGGGSADADRLLDIFQATELARGGRKSVGLGLLGQLFGVQQDPFSIVPALQAFNAAGGGVQAPVGAFGATGGAGAPSPFGGLVDRLLDDLAGFAAGQVEAPTPTPTATGTPTPSLLGLTSPRNNVRNARREIVPRLLGGQFLRRRKVQPGRLGVAR